MANQRIDVTRTTGNESNPRWARGETHVTFVRDNNLFIVPVQDVTAGALVQLVDVAVRRADARPTGSQKFLKDEERKILDWVDDEAGRRKRREALDRARGLPRFELTDRQSIADAAVSADGQFAYLVVTDRAQARTAQVPRFVSESAFTEEINARTKVGDAQDRRRLAVLNLESGEGVWAGLEGVSDAIAVPKPVDSDERKPPTPGAVEGTANPDAAPLAPSNVEGKRDVRWGSPVLSPDGTLAMVSVRAADNTERWLALVDPASAKTKVLDYLKDEAWISDAGQGWLADSARVWFLAEHDGWMHLYTVAATVALPQRKQLTSGTFEIDQVELSLDGSSFCVQSTEQHRSHQLGRRVQAHPETPRDQPEEVEWETCRPTVPDWRI